MATNGRFFDAFSIAHVTWGALFELAGVPIVPALGAAIAFEAIENPMKTALPAVFADSAADGWQNMAGDVASFAGGYALSASVKRTEAGRFALVALGAITGAIWLDSVTKRQRSV